MTRVRPWIFGGLALVSTLAAGCGGDCKVIIHPTTGSTVDTIPIASTMGNCIVQAYGALDSVGPQPK